jgi:Fe-S-cluster containining protein
MLQASLYAFAVGCGGTIRWEFGQPYLIEHRNDGYYLHLNMETYRCEVHDKRPVPCRGFHCRENEKWKAWADYGKMIVNDGLMERIDRDNRTVYNGSKIK